MCEHWNNFAQPWSNRFYYHYQQEHAIMTNFFQKLINAPHYGGYSFNSYNPRNVCNEARYSSSCCCCCCCSCCPCYSSRRHSRESSRYSRSHSKVSSRYSRSHSRESSQYSRNHSRYSRSYSRYEEQPVKEEDSEERQDESCTSQYQDENCDEDSECEYEFNVDVIMAMRAAKEEIKNQEKLQSKKKKCLASKSNEGEKSDSDKDMKLIDHEGTNTISGSKIFKGLEGLNRVEEDFNQKYMMERIFGEKTSSVLRRETSMQSRFMELSDDNQAHLWPVLPLLL